MRGVPLYRYFIFYLYRYFIKLAHYRDEEAIELLERAHEALENLRKINAMLHGIVELLGRQPAPPASADDVAGTLRNVQELSRIAEQELHAVILACTRARQHRLATSTMTKPTIH